MIDAVVVALDVIVFVKVKVVPPAPLFLYT